MQRILQPANSNTTFRGFPQCYSKLHDTINASHVTHRARTSKFPSKRSRPSVLKASQCSPQNMKFKCQHKCPKFSLQDTFLFFSPYLLQFPTLCLASRVSSPEGRAGIAWKPSVIKVVTLTTQLLTAYIVLFQIIS